MVELNHALGDSVMPISGAVMNDSKLLFQIYLKSKVIVEEEDIFGVSRSPKLTDCVSGFNINCMIDNETIVILFSSEFWKKTLYKISQI